jgi:sulfate adenylyltransferase
VYGTTDVFHPGVEHIVQRTNPWYVGGRLEGIQLPAHYDFLSLRLTPAELRAEFVRLGWRRIVAFQTRNPMHRAHQELTLRAARKVDANLLIHPSVGMTKPGDVEYYVRVRCYQALLSKYPKDTVQLALLPLAMRMGGPREAVWHAIIRKNHGASHFIVGRDHAGPGNDASGKPFYSPYAAQDLLRQYEQELNVNMVPFNMMVYVVDQDTYLPEDEVNNGTKVLNISGTELRRRLAEGREIPTWFTFPDVARELQRSYPPRHRQGFTVFFTGLSGSGKSTIANILRVKFLERGGRPVTLLDGDIVRKHLSSELGFSREHRDINIRRIGFVASEITQNGGIAICAPIAPFDDIRKEVRAMIQPHGGFVLVHLSTSLEVCESRDRKGLYAKARAGLVKQFTGVSDPYQPPTDAEVVIDTADVSPGEAAQEILLHLERQGFVGVNGNRIVPSRMTLDSSAPPQSSQNPAGERSPRAGRKQFDGRMTQAAIEPILERIREALETAGATLASFVPGAVAPSNKSSSRGPVAEADHAVNRVLRKILLRDGEGWLSEESVDDFDRLEKSQVWVVDPLDGTLEFIAGIPEWCVSIGWIDQGRAAAGGIFNPVTKELFLGSLASGVTYNGKPVQASGRPELAGAVVLASRSEVRRGEWNRFQNESFTVLSTGSVAYKLARVAAGLADATWTLSPKNEWDIAAGVALVESAGGFAESLDGSPLTFNRRSTLLPGLIAGGAKLQGEISGFLKGPLPCQDSWKSLMAHRKESFADAMRLAQMKEESAIEHQ